MKEIQLTQGKVALVDDEDYEHLNQWKWFAQKDTSVKKEKFYACRQIRLDNGKQTAIRMHRQIMNTPQDMLADHIDGDGLNNQKYNLRNCTTAQNNMNRRNTHESLSEFKGVSFNKRRGMWAAQIQYCRKNIHIGYFVFEYEAAMAYDNMALKLFGEFAYLNKFKNKTDENN